jgi:hypothetical protein
MLIIVEEAIVVEVAVAVAVVVVVVVAVVVAVVIELAVASLPSNGSCIGRATVSKRRYAHTRFTQSNGLWLNSAKFPYFTPKSGYGKKIKYYWLNNQ